MKKTLSKLLALALTTSLVLSGCGGNAEGGNSEANTQGGQANAEGSDKKEEASSKDEIKDLYITTITSDSNNAHNAYLCEKRPTKFSYQMHLNFQRKDENGNLDENWNKAVANYAFRQCFYKGLNLVNYYARTNKINP